VRAKLRVAEVKDIGEWSIYENNDYANPIPCTAKQVRLTAVTFNQDDPTPENERFNRATPSAQFEMTILNPTAAEAFQVGDEFYADFTRCQP
jgi:hypothetical protein